MLGERHVVLCANDRADEVRERLRTSGCASPIEFDSTLGAPAGWMGFREVLPTLPVKPSAEGDILDALCPQPEFEIVLAGGIRLERSTWLEGFPPRIRLRGDAAAAGDVWIDGELARRDPDDDGYLAEHWDRLGDHVVWCAGKSASYSIAPGTEAWETWDAYRWSFGELATIDAPQRPAICGVLTLPPRRGRHDDLSAARRGIVIPASNPILLGAAPGQIYAAPVRGDLRARTCAAFPPFDPVWALPVDPLHCDKRSSRVRLVGPSIEPGTSPPSPNVSAWYSAILTASRKGLLTEPNAADVAGLWQRYKQVARALRRRSR